jgi:glutamine synthetase
LTRDELLEILKTGKVDYIRVEFVDVLGHVRGRSLRRIEFEENIDVGFSFPESLAILDYTDRPLDNRSSEVIAIPDSSTFVLVPYLERTSRVLSFLTYEDGTTHPLCSRSVLKRAVTKLEERGYRPMASFTISFYLLRNRNGVFQPVDKAKAYSPEGLLLQQDFLKSMIKDLEELGVPIQRVNKYYGPGQYELSLVPADLLTATDNLVKAKEVIVDVATMYNMVASFMPKPFTEYPENTLEISLGMKDAEGTNVLIDSADPRGLGISRQGYSFTGGILYHLKGICALTLPTVNSYKRLKSEASGIIPSVGKDRSYIIRPIYGFRKAGMISFRLIDPLANPYLAIASIIFSGIDGMKREQDAMSLNPKELPQSLSEALTSLALDSYLNEVLGEELISTYISLKRRELEDYAKSVTDWEREHYLRGGC